MSAATYDLTSDAGRVRLLIPDADVSAPVFTDAEIAALLEIEGGDVRRAAALALETIAADEAKTLRITSALGLSVNGVAAAQALLERARRLREQAAAAEADDGGGFAWAEMVFDLNARERLRAAALRDVP